MVVSCDKDVNGCHGGDSVSAYAYIKDRGVTDETCSVYQAADLSCNKKVICETCNPRACSIPDKFYKYTVSSIGQFSGYVTHSHIMFPQTSTSPWSPP